MSSVQEAVNETAARQRHLITRPQAHQAGLSNRQIRLRLSSRRWVETYPDVFCIGGPVPDRRTLILAAVLAVPGGRAARETVLELTDVSTVEVPEVIHVVGPFGTNLRLPEVVVHQTRCLDPIDLQEIDGIPALTLERTVIDLAGGLDRTTRISLVDDVLCADGTTRHRLHLRAKALSNGRAGVAHVAELTHPRSAELFRSWLERHAAACFLEAGLPPAQWNVELWDEHGRIGVADCVFAGGRVVVELDGLKYHSSPAQRRRDNQKDRRVALSRRICLRYTWLDLVRRPDAVVAEIREAIASVEDGALTR